MSVYQYKKYKISIQSDSKKTQGLQTGDIVRRQYFDGKNLIYSLMCVIDYGVDKSIDSQNNIVEQQYFIGALLEGDEPKSEEILDFARITNLFNTARSGALYLTGSDEQAPYMDVIDGIGRNASLCWPENIATNDYEDSESQYVVRGSEAISVEYIASENDNYRICHFQRKDVLYYNFIGIQQDFYQLVQNPNRVLISYKIKGSRDKMSYKVSLGYQDGTRTDGEETAVLSTDWQYKIHAITVDFSGRYLRTCKVNLSAMESGDEVWIADFNIILLSSLTNFNDASKIRVGKLDGITDPVFGQLNGYGGYLQKLFASKSAHISGTLTAGDENGFAATFYAGKIHRNVFVNSLDIDFVGSITLDSILHNPIGIGNIYSSNGAITMNAQSGEWLSQHVGDTYTFSMWIYAKCPCQLTILQNTKAISVLQIPVQETEAWYRRKVTFQLQSPMQTGDSLQLSIVPAFEDSEDEKLFYITGPQLESGDLVTQYQPTDAVLNYTEDYGAWFNRGGIGGTIQNPLLQLNFDGEGSIGTRSNSVLIKTDGSGHLANNNIKWDKNGDVTFGKNVTMTWDNLDHTVQDELVSKSIRITGVDTFTLLGDMTGADPTTNPADITLTLEEENLQSTSSQRQWYYLDGYDYIPFEGENGKTLTILPFADYWNNLNSLTIKCNVIFSDEEYTATFTVKKQYIVGYSIEITSTQGLSYKNNSCETILTANVYYQGKLVDPDYVAQNYTFKWSKYHLPDMEHPVEGWWNEQIDEEGNVIQEAIDTSKQSIVLNYGISGQDCYVCELLAGPMFPYEFPLTF